MSEQQTQSDINQREYDQIRIEQVNASAQRKLTSILETLDGVEPREAAKAIVNLITQCQIPYVTINY